MMGGVDVARVMVDGVMGGCFVYWVDTRTMDRLSHSREYVFGSK